MPEFEADYIIIGSGSAGSTLAYRLSENGRYRVAVVEYGGTDAGPLIQMPAALSYPMNMPLYDWGFQSEPTTCQVSFQADSASVLLWPVPLPMIRP